MCDLLQQLPLGKQNSRMSLRLIIPLVIDASLRPMRFPLLVVFISDCLYLKIYLFYLIIFSECNVTVPVMIHEVMKQPCELNHFLHFNNSRHKAKCKM